MYDIFSLDWTFLERHMSTNISRHTGLVDAVAHNKLGQQGVCMVIYRRI